MKNVLKNDVFSFNCLNKKNSETSEVIFWSSKLALYPQKPNLGYRTLLVKILKLYQLVEETKKPASSVCTSCLRISPFLHLLHSDQETEDTGSKSKQGRGKTSAESRQQPRKLWKHFSQRFEGDSRISECLCENSR